MLRFPASNVRRGFSLIELVVVLMILAIIAGVTVSIVSWLRRSADKGTASNVMGSLLENIELYRTVNGSYPNQFDSLIKSGASALYDGDGSADTGLPASVRTGSNAKLTTTTLNAQTLASLTKIGINTVMDHVPGSGLENFPGNTGTSSRVLADGGTVASVNGATTNGARIIDSVYPPLAGGSSGSGLPANVNLIVFGFGPRNTAIGKTIVSPPSYSGVGDPAAIYDRYLCIFAVYTDGKRAQLKAVTDTTGDFLNQEMAEFWDNKPE